ncbi:hypothetical protein D3C84_1007710 [compost metagenome]
MRLRGRVAVPIVNLSKFSRHGTVVDVLAMRFRVMQAGDERYGLPWQVAKLGDELHTIGFIGVCHYLGGADEFNLHVSLATLCASRWIRFWGNTTQHRQCLRPRLTDARCPH